MSTDIINDLAMDMAMERHGAFNAEDRADEYADLAETVYRNHVEPQDAIKRELLEALEGVLGEALTYQLRESDLVVETARAAIAKAKGGAA